MDSDLQQQIAQLRHELELTHERESLLARIEAATRTAIDPVQITFNAVELLGRHMRVHRCAYAEVEPDQDTAVVIGNFVDGLPSMIGTYSLRRFSTSLHDLLISGSPFVVDDVEADPRCAAVLQSFRDTGIRSTISYPLMKDSHLTSILAVHATEPRHWTEKEIDLVATVAARCWESIERARTLRALEADREELRLKSEESERQHAELKTIYDTAPIGLAYFDLDDYHYLSLNDRQAAFFGLKPAQVVGRTLTEMAPIPGLRELFDQVARGEPVINYPLEGTLVTDPNEYRYWTVSYFPVHGLDGAIQGITAASLEITQQKKAEKALIQADKLAAVGRLAASIAHEINNPLEAITNLLFLARATDDIDQLRHFLDSADAELRRVSAITSQTLRFHRQSSGPQHVDTAALVNEILNVYQGRIRNSQTRLSTRFSARHPVKCFDGEIRQVLANFIANALDAMNSEPGTLTLRTREATHWRTGQRGVVFTVADTGSGITKSATNRLFEPFYTTKGTIGTGLGLWVSREIISRHHGSIRFRSSRSSHRHGTVFSFFLPFDSPIH